MESSVKVPRLVNSWQNQQTKRDRDSFRKVQWVKRKWQMFLAVVDRRIKGSTQIPARWIDFFIAWSFIASEITCLHSASKKNCRYDHTKRGTNEWHSGEMKCSDTETRFNDDWRKRPFEDGGHYRPCRYKRREWSFTPRNMSIHTKAPQLIGDKGHILWPLDCDASHGCFYFWGRTGRRG